MIDSSLIIHALLFCKFFKLILLWGYRSKTSTYFLLRFHLTNLIPLCCGTKFCTKFCTNDPNGNSGHSVKHKCMFMLSFLGCDSCLHTLQLDLYSEDGSKEFLRYLTINILYMNTVSHTFGLSQSGRIITVELAALYVRPNFADSVVQARKVTTGVREAFYHDHVDRISVAQYLMNTEGSL